MRRGAAWHRRSIRPWVRPWVRRAASRRLDRLLDGRASGADERGRASGADESARVAWTDGRGRASWTDIRGRRRLSRPDAGSDQELRRALPAALGLLAAALRGGSPPGQALEAVGSALQQAGGEIPAGALLGRRLRQVAISLRLGADLRSAWDSVPEALPGRPLAGLALALFRLDEGGAPVAAALVALATELRAEQRAASMAAARRAGVLAVLPLGLCFLPAFVLIAVLPVVVAAARQVLGS